MQDDSGIYIDWTYHTATHCHDGLTQERRHIWYGCDSNWTNAAVVDTAWYYESNWNSCRTWWKYSHSCD